MNINNNYIERMSDIPNNINSNYSRREFNTNSFNDKKILTNNFNNNVNNMEFEENQKILDISDNQNIDINKRTNKINENNIYNYSSNRSYFSKNENKKNKPSFISKSKSNDISVYSQQNEIQNIENEYEENDENYIEDKNISDRKREKIYTTNNSQRFSVITNENEKNRKKLMKERLDYLEGNIIEIKKQLNLISENLSFFSSKEFFMNNFKEEIILICEEIYNENNNNEKNNSSFISNTNYGTQNNKKNNEILLENEINRKLDEKLGYLKNNLYDKFLQPTINKIGDSMKKNIEQIKTQVDTLGNNLYKQKNILEKNNNYFGNDEYDEENIYKSSSHLRNEKFDEINRISEKLYNKLLEKEKKLKILKQERSKFLYEENE